MATRKTKRTTADTKNDNGAPTQREKNTPEDDGSSPGDQTPTAGQPAENPDQDSKTSRQTSEASSKAAAEASSQTAGQTSEAAASTQSDKATGEDGAGDVDSPVKKTVTAVEPGVDFTIPRAKEGEAHKTFWERCRKAARAAGMPRGQGPGTAYQWATDYAEENPPPPKPKPEPDPVEEPAEEVVEEAPKAPDPAPVEPDSVPGLGDIPSDWPKMSANAPHQVEISWVSANRLVVRRGSGVDLSKALSPAPSYSALSWLETSILFPSKFADISVKATQNQEEDKEEVRREKLAIEEIRSLMKEMLEDRGGANS